MTDTPIALTVHDGRGTPPNWRRELIAAWLTANDIDPQNVTPHHPISILTVPFRPEETADGGPWMLQVIVLHQYYVNANGSKEQDLIARKPVVFLRTVPLKVPFPPESTTVDEGPRHGEEQEVRPVEEDQRPPQHQGRPQEDEQQTVRPAATEEVPHRRPGPRPQRTGEGFAARITVAEEGRQEGRGAQVPQPEEEEVAQ